VADTQLALGCRDGPLVGVPGSGCDEVGAKEGGVDADASRVDVGGTVPQPTALASAVEESALDAAPEWVAAEDGCADADAPGELLALTLCAALADAEGDGVPLREGSGEGEAPREAGTDTVAAGAPVTKPLALGEGDALDALEARPEADADGVGGKDCAGVALVRGDEEADGEALMWALLRGDADAALLPTAGWLGNSVWDAGGEAELCVEAPAGAERAALSLPALVGRGAAEGSLELDPKAGVGVPSAEACENELLVAAREGETAAVFEGPFVAVAGRLGVARGVAEPLREVEGEAVGERDAAGEALFRKDAVGDALSAAGADVVAEPAGEGVPSSALPEGAREAHGESDAAALREEIAMLTEKMVCVEAGELEPPRALEEVAVEVGVPLGEADCGSNAGGGGGDNAPTEAEGASGAAPRLAGGGVLLAEGVALGDAPDDIVSVEVADALICKVVVGELVCVAVAIAVSLPVVLGVGVAVPLAEAVPVHVGVTLPVGDGVGEAVTDCVLVGEGVPLLVGVAERLAPRARDGSTEGDPLGECEGVPVPLIVGVGVPVRV